MFDILAVAVQLDGIIDVDDIHLLYVGISIFLNIAFFHLLFCFDY